MTSNFFVSKSIRPSRVPEAILIHGHMRVITNGFKSLVIVHVFIWSYHTWTMCIGLGRYQAPSVPVADPGNVPGDWYFQIKTQNQWMMQSYWVVVYNWCSNRISRVRLSVYVYALITNFQTYNKLGSPTKSISYNVLTTLSVYIRL